MRYLILGAGGFIGQHILQALLDRQAEVIAYDRPDAVQDLKNRYPQLRCFAGDFTTEQNWKHLLHGVDVCFHLIATMLPKPSNDDPLADVSQNLLGTLRLLEGARYSRTKLIFTSSGGTVYGQPDTERMNEQHATNPLCSYGITKLAIEKYLGLYQHIHGVKSVSLRIANPYGPEQKPESIQGVIAVFMGRILQNHAIQIWGDGSVVRDYIFIGDVVNALLCAADYTGSRMVFNIGYGSGHSLREIVHMIEKVTHKKAHIVQLAARSFDIPKSILDISAAQKELHWRPSIGLETGLTATFNWMQHHLALNPETPKYSRHIEGRQLSPRPPLAGRARKTIL